MGQCWAVKHRSQSQRQSHRLMGMTVMTFKFDDHFHTLNQQGCLGYYHIKNISKQCSKAETWRFSSS